MKLHLYEDLWIKDGVKMKNRIWRTKRVALILLALCIIALTSSCVTRRMRNYYAQESNYINATGIVTYISYNDDKSALYLGFSDLTPRFDDNCFKIVGDNLPIAQQNGIDDKIKLGDQVDFVTAPKYFGDGYVMPIVEITVDGETLLAFEDGYPNLLEWLDNIRIISSDRWGNTRRIL